MLEITYSLPKFNMAPANVNSMTGQIKLSLDKNKSNCNIEGITLYQKEEEVVYADVIVPYEYDSKNHMIRISAPDYKGENAVKTTIKRNGKKVESDLLEHGQAIKRWTHENNSAIYEQIFNSAKEKGMTILVRNNWNKELVKNIWVHYKDGVFAGMSSKEIPSNEGEYLPLTSVAGGLLHLPAQSGIPFWNIEGSTGDVEDFDRGQPLSSRRGWIGYLDKMVYEYTQPNGILPQQNCVCYCKDDSLIPCGNRNLVGGHIVFDENHVRPTEEVLKNFHVVGLLPICRTHNNFFNKEAMSNAIEAYGIWLDKYRGTIYK